jgi:hypothetical protein
MVRDIDTLNDEMEAAGVRLFAGGLSAASSATSLRRPLSQTTLACPRFASISRLRELCRRSLQIRTKLVVAGK